MTLYTPLFLEAVTGDTAITYHMQDLRILTQALAPQQGIILLGDMAVTQRGAGANMSVDVAAGRCIIAGGSIANQGSYICRSDAAFNVPIQAADATNPRIDIIVAKVNDKQADGGTTYGWTLTVVTGTPAASPTAPATPTSSLLLAQVYVRANSTTINTTDAGTNGYVTDKRVLSGVGDRPGWQCSGGDGQPVAGNGDTVYAPTTITVSGTTWTAGTGITIQTPGRYIIAWGCRIAASTGATNKTANFTQNRAGAELRRFSSQQFSTAITEHSTSGTMQLQAGDVVKPFATVANGTATTFSDAANQMSFTGFWLAP